MNIEIIKERFLGIWKDSVWSKVISAVIIGAFIIFKSYVEKITLLESLKAILNYDIKLYYIIGLVLFIFIIKYAFSYFNRKKNKMRKFNKKEITTRNVLMKWNIEFEDNIPTVKNFTLFCKNHSFPTKLVDNKCPHKTCANYKTIAQYDFLLSKLESEVIHKWDELNNKV